METPGQRRYREFKVWSDTSVKSGPASGIRGTGAVSDGCACNTAGAECPPGISGIRRILTEQRRYCVSANINSLGGDLIDW